jgi:hypothetical protein
VVAPAFILSHTVIVIAIFLLLPLDKFCSQVHTLTSLLICGANTENSSVYGDHQLGAWRQQQSQLPEHHATFKSRQWTKSKKRVLHLWCILVCKEDWLHWQVSGGFPQSYHTYDGIVPEVQLNLALSFPFIESVVWTMYSIIKQPWVISKYHRFKKTPLSVVRVACHSWKILSESCVDFLHDYYTESSTAYQQASVKNTARCWRTVDLFFFACWKNVYTNLTNCHFISKSSLVYKSSERPNCS